MVKKEIIDDWQERGMSKHPYFTTCQFGKKIYYKNLQQSRLTSTKVSTRIGRSKTTSLKN